MQDRHLYEYAVIRVVPRVEREEFLNVGIVLFCKSKKFLQMSYHLDENKLRLLSEEKIKEIVEALPEDWLHWEGADEDPEEIREAYVQFLLLRLANTQIFIKEAHNARQALI